MPETADGGFIAAGSSFSNDGDVTGNHGYCDFWVAKLSAEGALEWQKSLGGSREDEALPIQQTADGGFVAAGFSRSNDGDVSGSHKREDLWAARLSPKGELEWQRPLGGSESESANSIPRTADGGFIAAGKSASDVGDSSANRGNYDLWIVKLSPAGELEWEKSLGGSLWDEALSLRQTADGGFVAAGVSYSGDGDVAGRRGHMDVWTVKLSPEGALEAPEPSAAAG